MLKFILFLSSYCLAPYIAHALPSPMALTRASAQEMAIGRNYALNTLRYEVERAQASSIGAGLLPNPELGISGASGFLSSSQSSYTWSASLSQQFPITGKLRLLRSVAAEEIALAQAEVAKAEYALKYAVATLFDHLENTTAEASMVHETIALNKEWLSFLTNKIKKAEASPLDASHTQIVIADLEQRALALDRKRTTQLDELKRLCAIDSSQEIIVNASLSANPSELPALTADALDKHPSLVLKEQLATLAYNQKKLALANRWDDLTVALFYEEDYGMDEPMGYERDRLVGLSFSIPLPIRNKNLGQIESARIRERQLAMELDATKQELTQMAASLRNSYHSIGKQMAQYQAHLIRSSQERLSALESAYSSGLVEIAEVFRERERLLRLQTEYLSLKAEQATLLTEWLHTTAQL